MSRTNEKRLNSIIAPRSVAVIGASTRPDSIGRAVCANILFHNFQGIVYPVNPKAQSILGVRAYASVLDIPDEVDLAVIVVPAAVVPQVLEECGQKGVQGAVVISAGFKEIGPAGAPLEAQLVEVIRKYKISLIGPNCLGLINTDPSVSLDATFARVIPRAGNIVFISQSGAVGAAALEYAQTESIGLSKFISLGNKADLNENDLLEALRDDPESDVILLYLEDLANPKGFLELAQEITSEKPILAIKSGRTQEGAMAASSHTGALAGSDELYDSLFLQCGVLRVESLEELFEYAVAFANQPPPRGQRVAIVTNSGGPGIMATDAAVRHGLQLAKFGEQTRESLQQGLPITASIHNPVDLIGDADENRYEIAIRAVLADGNVDACLVICGPRALSDQDAIARVVAKSARGEKPVLACFMALEEIDNVLQILEEAKIPNYRFPEDAARALAKMAQYVGWVHRPRTEFRSFTDMDQVQAKMIISRARAEGRKFLPEPEAHALLKAYGFPVLTASLAKTEDEAARSANGIGYPVVLKIVSPDILHKVDVGGVKLNLQTEAQVRQAYQELMSAMKVVRPQAKIWGVFVQQYVSGGKEIILGLKRDPHFGSLLMFGLGGIYVEVLKDVTLRIAPIRELGAYRMIQQIRGYKILEGFRGEPPSDIDTIAECLLRLSQLSQEIVEIEELDINPLIVFNKGRGARVVDARILLRQEGVRST